MTHKFIRGVQISSHQENPNENHTKIPHQNSYKCQVLARMWGNWNCQALGGSVKLALPHPVVQKFLS